MKVKHAIRLTVGALILCGLKVVHVLLRTDRFPYENVSNLAQPNEKQRWIPTDKLDESVPFQNVKQHKTPDLNKNWLLFWGYRWNREGWPPEGYEMDNCTVTYNRGKAIEAKAVVIHSTNLVPTDFPWKLPRRPDQLYIWWNSETPFAVFRETPISAMKNYSENFFNWTMTYRLTADVVWNYGYRGDLFWRLPLGKEVVDKIIADKRNTAVIVMSNCNILKESSSRRQYVEDVAKAGLQITFLGKCYNKYVSNEEMVASLREHKFYFAFENARHCRDYITEKFWDNSLLKGTVPIVMGPVKEDVLKVAPLNSFIFAEDFTSPAKLAEYLLYLDRNENEYRKFFRWREDKSMTDEKMIELTKKAHPDITPQQPPERLCEKVLKNTETKIIKSLTEVIVANDPPECLDN